MDFDTAVKLNIYATIAEQARVPGAVGVAQALEAPLEEVLAAFERLHQMRLLVPEPGDPVHIRMAPPFSGVKTPFPVQVGDKLYYANCAWDALGIPAALHTDALVQASDGFTAEALSLEVRGGKPVPQDVVIHFAVPAARWRQDIIYT